jgi:hypothetical protein
VPLSSRWPCHGHVDRYGRGERLCAGELRRRGKFVPAALQQARRAGPQFPLPVTPADSTRRKRVGAVRECRSFSDPALAMSASSSKTRGLPHAFASLPLGLRKRSLRTRVRAAVAAKGRNIVAARTNSPARGLSAVRASRERLMRGTAPAGRRGHLRGFSQSRQAAPSISALEAGSRHARDVSPRTATVARFPFSLPLPGSRAPVLSVLFVLLPGTSVPARVGRGAQLVEHRRRTRTEETHAQCKAFSSESSRDLRRALLTPPARWPSVARPKYVGFAYVKVASATRRPRGDHLGAKRRGK